MSTYYVQRHIFYWHLLICCYNTVIKSQYSNFLKWHYNQIQEWRFICADTINSLETFWILKLVEATSFGNKTVIFFRLYVHTIKTRNGFSTSIFWRIQLISKSYTSGCNSMSSFGLPPIIQNRNFELILGPQSCFMVTVLTSNKKVL